MKFTRPISRLFSTSSSPQQQLTINKYTNRSSIKELHANLIRLYLNTDPSPSILTILKFYASSTHSLHKAISVFNSIQRPTSSIFNHMIRGLSQLENPHKAFELYYSMHRQGIPMNHLTFIFVSRVCSRVCDVRISQMMVHTQCLKLGFTTHLFVSNALMHMYGCYGEIGYAKKVFDEMPERDLVSWNSLICGYSQCNRFKDVLGLFLDLQRANVMADAVTMMKVILACNQLGDMEFADYAVKYIEENRVIVNVYLGNTLIDMYGQRGLVESARDVFDRMNERNLVSWNVMIMAYVKAGDLVEAEKLFNKMPSRDVVSWTTMIIGNSEASQFSRAVKLFEDMMAQNIMPDEITLASVLSACAHLGRLDMGVAVHRCIGKLGLKADTCLLNSLIDFYFKCGSVEKAMEVFQGMKQKDRISWTTAISGLAVNGFADSALEVFSQMLNENVQPTHGTFTGVLLACAHAGLVDKGLELFSSMEVVHGLVPEMKHYGCVVDLLGRLGYLNRAYEFITRMPVSPDVVVWRILLSACKLHNNVFLAEIVTKKLLELDPANSGNYVLLSNAYASSERWVEATSMRKLMEDSEVQKPSGWSSIEFNGPLDKKSRK